MVERAQLDLKLEGGPEEPTTYGDVVVSHTRAPSHVREGAASDGAVARKAASRKRGRYPEEEVPGAKLVPFSVEVGGRWDDSTLKFLKRAAGRAAVRHPGLAALGGQGAAAVYNSWITQLSCALQKANVACLRSASAGGRSPAPEARADGAGPQGGEEDVGDGTEDWLAQEIEDLIQCAAASAAAEGP